MASLITRAASLSVITSIIAEPRVELVDGMADDLARARLGAALAQHPDDGAEPSLGAAVQANAQKPVLRHVGQRNTASCRCQSHASRRHPVLRCRLARAV